MFVDHIASNLHAYGQSYCDKYDFGCSPQFEHKKGHLTKLWERLKPSRPWQFARPERNSVRPGRESHLASDKGI